MCNELFFFYRDLHFLDAGVNVQDCVVARADDGLVFDDDDLKTKRKRFKRSHTNQSSSSQNFPSAVDCKEGRGYSTNKKKNPLDVKRVSTLRCNTKGCLRRSLCLGLMTRLLDN